MSSVLGGRRPWEGEHISVRSLPIGCCDCVTEVCESGSVDKR